MERSVSCFFDDGPRAGGLVVLALKEENGVFPLPAVIACPGYDGCYRLQRFDARDAYYRWDHT